MRPTSLTDVVNAVEAGEPFNAAISEFLDSFYTAKPEHQHSMILGEPPLLKDSQSNVYIAAVAEHLALKYDLTIPYWVSQPVRFLREPWFPAGLESLKATCIKESPVAFRRRLIFVDKEPLYRPRKDKPDFASDYTMAIG